MRQISADGAAVTDLRMGDMRQCFADQRKRQRKSRVALQRAVARQRAKAARAFGRTNAREIFDTVDVDQDRRPGETKIHRRYQALSAGQELRLIAMFGLERQRVRKRGGCDIFEGSQLHGARMQESKTRLPSSSETPRKV